jgi:Mg-chelatase subunit ChlD
VVFVLDSSGSMRESKMDYAKRAGIALAYKAIEEGNKIGLVVFSTEVIHKQEPTNDFRMMLRKITPITPKMGTNLAEAIRTAVGLFPKGRLTKHIIAITDALPTHGKQPEIDTLTEVSNAKSHGITISLVGVGLEPQGERLAKKITEMGEGRLYTVKELKNLGRIVLLDYFAL